MISLWSDTKIIISVIVIAALFFCYQKIKHESYAAGEKHQIELYEKQLMKNQKYFMERYFQLEKKQNDLMLSYEMKVISLKAKHEQLIKDFEDEKLKLKDTISVSAADLNKCLHKSETSSGSGMQKTFNSGQLECYSRDELRERIKRTLAVGNRCDELAEKFNTLLSICNMN